MLTHRNKKPYECKAEGCGKSYCDARSLRRHTENHHAGSKVNESVSPSSPTTGPHTPNTPGSNPSTPSTPGATSTPNGHGHPALKQLLATEPTQAQQQKVRLIAYTIARLNQNCNYLFYLLPKEFLTSVVVLFLKVILVSANTGYPLGNLIRKLCRVCQSIYRDTVFSKLVRYWFAWDRFKGLE